MTDELDPRRGVERPCELPCEGDVVELPLLLPGWQVMKLETVAHQRGMTAAAMVRFLLRNFLTVAPVKQSAPLP